MEFPGYMTEVCLFPNAPLWIKTHASVEMNDG